MASVVVHHANGRVEDYLLRLGSQIVGRDTDCEIVIPDQSISRRHARIYRDPSGDFFIEDNASKNGTFVNGEAVGQRRLSDGDRIMLGAIQLTYRRYAPPAPSSTQVVLADKPNATSASFASASRELVLPRRRLEMLYDLSDRLTCLRDRGELLEDVMDICFETLRFERGLIALKHPRGQEPDWPVVRNLKSDDSGRLTISRTLVNRAMEYGERSIINDPLTDMADPTMSMAEFHIRSAMCVPIMYREEVLGVIYGDLVSNSTTYQQDDVDFLAGLARQLSVGLVNTRLLATEQDKLQLESELALARQIQTDLYPSEPLDTDAVFVAGFNEPGRQVSGDYYDVMPFEDGRIGVVIADVVGKGVSAALLTANLQAAVRVLLPHTQSLPDAMMRWNRLIHTNTDAAKFITAAVGILDPEQRRIEFATAGHFPPCLIEPSGDVTELSADRHFPFGLMPDEAYTSHVAEIPAGATLFFYTDGVTEALDSEGQQYGKERLTETLRSHVADDTPDLIRAVRADVNGFVGEAPQSDDITLMAIRFK